MPTTKATKNKNYLRDRNIPFDNLSDEQIQILVDEAKIVVRKEGALKRVKFLENKGVYRKKEYYHCITCSKKSLRTAYIYSKDGYCSKKCYPQELVDKNYVIGYLKNRNLYDGSKTYDELYEVFRGVRREDIIPTQPKRVSTIKEKYETGFKEIGIKGKNNHRRSFILTNGLVDSVDLEKLSDEEIDDLYLSNFDRITKRGESIKKGMLEKYGSEENITESYRLSFLKGLRKRYLESGGDEENATDEYILEQWSEYLSYVKQQTPYGKIEWKKKHFINMGLNVSDLSDSHIDIMYSEYLSNRFKLSDCLSNGYKTTLKGWYTFFNKDIVFFYRSSWELRVLQVLDELIKNYDFQVNVPERIRYNFKYNRNYYPDIEILNNSGTKYVLEIKPKRKLSDPINIAKIEMAKKCLGDNFKVLTEDLIFSEEIESFLENLIKN